MLARVDGIEDLSLTTNGYLLERDADALVEAGITRVNVSIDSLQRDRFFQITRRDSLPQVLRGLEAIARASRGAPDQGERGGDARLHRGGGDPVRRVRPLDRASRCASSSSCRSTATTPGARTRCSPARSCARSSTASTRSRSCRASRTPPRACSASPTARGEIGFINPVSEPFCADCNRIRLTADGKLRTCLFSMHETDLREPLRAGASRRRARADRSATPSGARS